MLCRRFFIAILLAIGCCAPLPRGLAADSLSGLRDDVRTERPREEASSSSAPSASKKSWWSGTDDAHCDCDDDDDDGDATLGMLALAAFGAGIVVTSPYWVPIGLLEDDLARNGWYQAYPYASGSGSMVVGSERINALPPEDRFAWLIRPRVEYGDDFDSVSRWGGQILIEPAWGSPNVCASRFGFDSETNYWREALGGGRHDELWTGDANVVLRFAQNDWVQLRSGIGVAWLGDARQLDAGFNFTYSGDFYPVKPLVLSTELDAGWVGEAWLIHLRGTIGLQWRQVELFTGYDYREIGQSQLDGWVSGVRCSF